ncbi:N-6 DNA methylase [Planobispora siamensis]|uniref:N-6 DNA methylase n=1 Tax=Planobispora siamensis TaxID=936338 RepID=UPI0019502C90|nr:N-6 DNA methylase [Planobispora siamensis]
MSTEELAQKGYLTTEGIKGKRFGDFELLELGATTLSTLAKEGLDFTPASTISFPCTQYKPPARANLCKPDSVYLHRVGNRAFPIAVAEWKARSRFKKGNDALAAAEQAVVSALAMGVRIAITTDGTRFQYIDAVASASEGRIVNFPETRDFGPAVLSDLYRGESDVVRDPKPLAETVWQIIWHATKAEPKDCLLTFVEIFMLKFLSDNLPLAVLPADFRFDILLTDPEEFAKAKGSTQIEYYVNSIRPKIKQIFAERLTVSDEHVRNIFGLAAVVSQTTIINGFAFLRSSPTTTIPSYNRTFCEILAEFQRFGALTNIDPEFKLRLYETFLRRSARQQRLGQFFTPRNIVKPMIRMAMLNALPDNSVVLDPAAGVGGFILEPLLFPDALPGNVTFKDGEPQQRVKLIGVDVDVSTNILAKANMLLHLAESVRNPDTTTDALNQALANTFLLINENETLGSLLQPPRDSVDVILTNPPYVTQGSSIYRKEIEHLQGPRNGVSLRDYYDVGGLGVEALFLRYISGALKPGGRAFVIVPLGLLNRTAQRLKDELLSECNIRASIQLPRNAFFNTAQPTYILVLEKRKTSAQSRPPVFCGIARSIGETLDYERVPTPNDNDLSVLADLFVHYLQNPVEVTPTRPLTYEGCEFAKLVPSDAFAPDERWDVVRHWTDAEHVALGERAETIDRAEFIDLATDTLQDLIGELQQAKEELASLSARKTAKFSLSDPERFQIRSGIRIRNVDLREHPGDVPVYSVFTRPDTVKGHISLAWLEEKGYPPEPFPSVTVMATGASAVGTVFYREADCVMTDDVVIVQPWSIERGAEWLDDAIRNGGPVEPPSSDIDLGYLAVALSQTIAQGGYLYEAKLYTRRVRQLEIEVPITETGEPDLDRQRQIAAVVKRLDHIRAKLQEAGAWSKSVRLS